jgi:hypothetical protein
MGAMSAQMGPVVSAGKGPATEDLETCGCGERTDELEECWECGAVLCSGCVRIRMIDGYEAVYCPMCAPAGDEVSRS